jgi:hypothetical protein
MTGPALLVVALFAILVGATMPVLYQLHQVLRRARAVLDSSAPRLDRALDGLGQAADRLNGIGSTLQTGVDAIRPLVTAASTLGHVFDSSGRWLWAIAAVGGSVVPAVIAGVRAFFSRTPDHLEAGNRPAQQPHSKNGRPTNGHAQLK